MIHYFLPFKLFRGLPASLQLWSESEFGDPADRFGSVGEEQP